MIGSVVSLPRLNQEIAINAIRWNRGLGQIESRLDTFVRRTTRLGIGLSLTVSIPFQVMIGSTIRAFAQLDGAARASASKTGQATERMVKNIKRVSMELSKTIPLTETEIAKGIGTLIETGMSEKIAKKAIEPISQFAVVAETTVENATRQIIGTMTAMNMAIDDMGQMTRVMDTISFVARKTNSSIEDMADAFARAAPDGKKFRFELEEMAVVLGAYSQAGYRGAVAGTQFGIMVREITKASIEHQSKWRQIFGRDVVFNKEGGLNRTWDILLAMEEKLGKFSQKGLTKVFMDLGIPNRSVKALSALFGTGGGMKKMYEEMGMAKGDTLKQFIERMKSLDNTMLLIRNNFRRIGVVMGETFAPTVRLVSDLIRMLANFFDILPKPMKSVVGAFMLMVAAAGPLLIVLAALIRAITIISQLWKNYAAVSGIQAMISATGIPKLGGVYKMGAGPMGYTRGGMTSLPFKGKAGGMAALGVFFVSHAKDLIVKLTNAIIALTQVSVYLATSSYSYLRSGALGAGLRGFGGGLRTNFLGGQRGLYRGAGGRIHRMPQGMGGISGGLLGDLGYIFGPSMIESILGGRRGLYRGAGGRVGRMAFGMSGIVGGTAGGGMNLFTRFGAMLVRITGSFSKFLPLFGKMIVWLFALEVAFKSKAIRTGLALLINGLLNLGGVIMSTLGTIFKVFGWLTTAAAWLIDLIILGPINLVRRLFGFGKIEDSPAAKFNFGKKGGGSGKGGATSTIWSAQLKGTAEEYRARVMGTAQLITVAQATMIYARETAENTAEINAKTGGTGVVGSINRAIISLAPIR